MFTYLSIAAITFLLSYFGTFLVRWIAHQRGWVAHPRADRWHATPTALHGGIGIYVSFLLGFLALISWIHFGGQSVGVFFGYNGFLKDSLVILAGVTIIFIIGVVDDFHHLKPGVKLLGELVAVSLVIFLGKSFRFSPYEWLDIVVSYIWFVGIINATNLLDNMDGVSSGIVIVGAIGLILIGLLTGSGQIAYSVWIAGLLVVATLGFWLHNRPPARIFMGDSGSLVLGFVFAALTLPSDWNFHYIPVERHTMLDNLLRVLISVTLAAIPILDTSLVTITRLMRGQSPSQGGKDHSTHRLAQTGLSHWQTLGVLYSVSAVCVLTSLLMVAFPQYGFLVFTTVFVSITSIAVYLAFVRIQVAPIKKEGWQQLVTSVTYRLPLIKMMLDVLLISSAFYFSYLVRFDFEPAEEMITAMFRAMPIVVICCLISNWILKIYDFSWRSASSRDIVNYAGTAVLGTVMSISVVTLATSFGLGNSRGAFVLFCIVYFLGIAASRFSYRLIDDLLLSFRMQQSPEGRIPVLLYGTGRLVHGLVDEFNHEDERWKRYFIIGIVDSGSGSLGKKVQGIAVSSREKWAEHEFDQQPEIIVVDDEVSSEDIQDFAGKIGEGIRIRRYTRKIIEMS